MNAPERFPLLSTIESPADVRRLPATELGPLAGELRNFLIETVSRMGGHFAAGLGTVELTLALHYVFDTPDDRIVWDVGHQAYPHKVLTGRRDQLHTIRHQGGLLPFPARHESEYDTFGVGHSSTSISAALGMAIAAQRSGSQRKVVAVIGDGALSAGLAFEALNHAGATDLDLLVILNDNEMSISEAVGAISNYCARLLSGKLYSQLREQGKRVLRNLPSAWELARRSEVFVKGMVLPGTIFEEIGFNYIGPVDGHEIDTLTATLRNVRELSGPQLLHVVTQKGKGYAPAESDPIKWHGPGKFNHETGEIYKEPAPGLTYSQVFGRWICDMAQADPRIVAITPAMREGSGLVEYSQRFPDRYFDVAIAEQHAVTLAAGLACEQWHPVVAIYSTFLQRAYDQLIHDVALQCLPVVFAIDRGGLVGGDGATHQGSYDLSYLRCVPNMIVMAPADENECRQMLYTATQCGRPAAVRYPRGTGPGALIESTMTALPIGRAQVRRTGRAGLAILAFGTMVSLCERIADRHELTLINMRFVKPLDEELILRVAQTHRGFVTVEENVIAGGAGSAVNECLHAHGIVMPVLNCGIPDCFVGHGSREDNLQEAGLDQRAIERRILEWWRSQQRGLRTRDCVSV